MTIRRNWLARSIFSKQPKPRSRVLNPGYKENVVCFFLNEGSFSGPPYERHDRTLRVISPEEIVLIGRESLSVQGPEYSYNAPYPSQDWYYVEGQINSAFRNDDGEGIYIEKHGFLGWGTKMVRIHIKWEPTLPNQARK